MTSFCGFLICVLSVIIGCQALHDIFTFCSQGWAAWNGALIAGAVVAFFFGGAAFAEGD